MYYTATNKDRFLVNNDRILIIPQGTSVYSEENFLEFQSISDIDDYLKDTRSNDWDGIKQNYFDSKVPEWSRFNNTLLTDTYFNNLYNKLLVKHPLLFGSISTAITRIYQQDYNLFTQIYRIIHANAKQNEIEKWVKLAEDCNLPYPFQKMIKNPN